jgi:ubiquinol-cytochrome c reductase cytochrome b subunit
MHPDNYIPANPLVTPLSIVPEWYLLPFYAILRAIPDKLGGVIAMLGSLLILLVLPFVHTNKIRSSRFSPLNKILFYVFCSNFFLLVVLGSLPIQSPYVGMSQLSCFIYFSYFIVIALIGKIDNLLFSFSEYSQSSVVVTNNKSNSL